MNTKLDFDASKLFEAMKYQIHVAIDYCHTLETHDVLWIETYGDVTIEGQGQIEVKDYSDRLTDGHENFWNTLNNWLKPSFCHQQYTSLILLTTQAYGERASLSNWESFDIDQRLEVLESIYKSAEARFEKASRSNNENRSGLFNEEMEGRVVESNGINPTKVLKLQRKILAMDMRVSLMEALPKIKIVTEQPDLMGLLARYKMRYLKGIQPHKMDSFLNDLFGFMTDSLKITGCWKFTVDEFNKKFAELTARYLIGTLKFPSVNRELIETKAVDMDVRSRRFAMKLDEIGGNTELILQATVDLLQAQQYIAEVIKDYTTSKKDIDDYYRNQSRMHGASRFSAMCKCEPTLSHDQLKRASCAFYGDRCAVPVDPFTSYDFTPIEFRNGIYHMLADEEPKSPISEFHWRLWK